jgi:hypothetical protein
MIERLVKEKLGIPEIQGHIDYVRKLRRDRGTRHTHTCITHIFFKKTVSSLLRNTGNRKLNDNLSNTTLI